MKIIFTILRTNFIAYGLLVFFLCFYTEGSAQVSINTDGALPSNKAILDVQSTTKGTHITRMTSAQRIAITPTANDIGLMVFDTDKNRLYLFDGEVWLPLAVSNPVDMPLTARSVSNVSSSFGYSVSISGDYAIIGAYNDQIGILLVGSAFIFYRSGNTWTQQAKLVAPDGTNQDYFGASVSISGDYAIVGAPEQRIGGVSYQGSAYIFHRSGTTWPLDIKLTDPNGTFAEDFGRSVSISGDYAVVGATYGKVTGVSQGLVFVYNRGSSGWAQQYKISAVDGAVHDFFGYSVSISGDYIVIGAPQDDINVNADQGSAYIFGRVGTFWAQITKLTDLYGAASDKFGWSVAISSDYGIIGAPGADIFGVGVDVGQAFVFNHSSGSWSLSVVQAIDMNAGDKFGESVSIAGEYAIVGASKETVGTVTNQGSSYIFKKNGAYWSHKKKLTNMASGNTNANFGISVSLTPNACLIGESSGINSSTGLYTGAVHFGVIDF
jgi:hypothetical protein